MNSTSFFPGFTGVPGAPADSAQALGADMAGAMKSLAALNLSAADLGAIQADYLRQATALWNDMVPSGASAAAGEAATGNGPTAKPVSDRRFAATDWQSNPMANFAARMYLLNAQVLTSMADKVQGDEKTRQRIRFAVDQWVAATSPSNFLALNPEALRLAVESKGESLRSGMAQLWNDIQQGHVSQTDERVFEVGRNVATTPGTVVFENEILQLIEYAPTTAKVHERPLLIVPPCINKYYILDLQPANSLVKFSLDQGHRVFLVSWRNADESMAQMGWDTYIEEGPIRAIEVMREITGAAKVNTLGFCIGGTLLATAVAVLRAREEDPVQSLTLLTSFLDFTDTGVLDIFVDEASVQLREMTIGTASPTQGGVLKGQELASTFSALRPNDLHWNYVVGNYLKGTAPPAFDLLYWNSDSTNLPGPMYCWYLRNTYLENNLVKAGKLTVCGQLLDLARIDVPTYLYGSREDHIVPWDAAYRSVKALPGVKQIRFVLGASGHIAGVVNPPAAKKRSHWIAEGKTLPADADEWMQKAREHAGSWWPDWAAWLAAQAGREVAAPRKPGSRAHPAIEPAPGRYVRKKA